MMIGANDLPRSVRFYDAVMDALGHPRILDGDERWPSWGKPDPNPHITIGTPFNGYPATAGNGMMVSFVAQTRDAVVKFHAAALSNGGTDEGAPGLRPHYGPSFYSAYVRDPDGNKLNAVCYTDAAGDAA